MTEDNAARGCGRRLLLLTGLVAVMIGAAAALRWAGGPASGPFDAAAVKKTVLNWWLARQAEALEPVSTDGVQVSFEVRPGEPLPAIAARLEARGLVRSASAFVLLARARGLDRQVQAGVRDLNPSMSAEEVLEGLLVGHGAAVTITLPEGLRAEEVADRLAEAGLVDRSEFLSLVGAGETDIPLIASRPAGSGLEGYLFPDTYSFAPGAGASKVLAKMLATWARRVGTTAEARASELGLSLHEAVTLASIVEREAVIDTERARIARVYLNRLADPPHILNADPTVQYALGYYVDQGTWWKRGLTEADLAYDSAYNTYVHAGLPPGPIANPGLASIVAVLEPEPGDWRYFVANDVACDGSHVFAATWEQHLANIARYQTGECSSE